MHKLSYRNVIKFYDIFENNNKGFKDCNAKLIFYYLLIALEYIH